MDNNIPRRSSTGRSNVIDQSIRTLEDMLKNNQCDLDDISMQIINNTLPSELRSIIWKIILGILPQNQDPFEWVQIIKNSRDNFDKISKDEDIEILVKILRNEEEEKILEYNILLEDYQLIVNELKKISSYFDFFKSKTVAETLLRLYFIWRRSNSDSKTNIESFYILAGVIYILYPSIIHFTTENKEINSKQDVTPKALFYFLNDEEYFDSDTYLLFNALMTKIGLNNPKVELSSHTRQDLDLIKSEIINSNELFPLSQVKRYFISNLNKYERISYFYLKIVNQNLLISLLSKNLDLYDIVRDCYVSLLTNIITFEHLSYFWDNLFLNSLCDTSQLEFIDYLVLALISNASYDILAEDSTSRKNIFGKFLQKSSKEVVLKSMKIREKILDLLMD